MTKASDVAKLEAALADRWWRLSNLYWITDPAGKAVQFRPNEAQTKLWNELHTLNVIPKARQLGFSTFIALFILDTCLWRLNTSAGVVDMTLDDAKAKLEKMRFAYDRLPAELKQQIELTKSNQTELCWSNGSSVSVGTSHRGGTLQILHVSEYGKISAAYPEKAREIRTGAFGTVHSGQMIFVESTAEGVDGHFYDIVKQADDLKKSGRDLSRQQFKLHFFPWWAHPGYVEPADSAVITTELQSYFDDISGKYDVHLTPEQRAWYVLKRQQIGPDDMGREYPSFLDEAFAHSVEGAYFQTQMSKLRAERRIGVVPHDPSKPVHTSWDIGKSDNTSVWFFQSHGSMVHLIHYHENSGEGVEYYARYLKDISAQRGFNYGTHYGPHDLDNSHWILPGAKAIVDVARDLGVEFRVVPRIDRKANAIEAARNFLSMCWIDEEHCDRGIKCLDNYRKVWDDKRGTFRDEPYHDWASHGADALMTAACGHTPDYVPTPVDRYQRRRRSSGRSAWAA